MAPSLYMVGAMKSVIGFAALTVACGLQRVVRLPRGVPSFDVASTVFGYYNEDKPPPRVGKSAPIDLQKAETSVQHLQNFVARSSEGYASIVTMGDSTMAGVLSDLLTVNDKARQFLRIVHTTNDRPQKVRFTNDGSAVEPGGEWYDHDALKNPVAKVVLERSRAANDLLHSRNCTWAGGVETYLFDGGPLNGLAIHAWGFIPEYGDTCWKPCMGDAIKAFKSSAVLWNVGFHLLNHNFDKKTCDKRQNMGKQNCGDYSQLVTMGTQALLEATPIVIWRTTNWLCEARQRDHVPSSVTEDLDNWKDSSKRSSLESECHKNCDKLQGFTCYDWLMSAKTTQRLQWESADAIAKLQKAMPSKASQIRVLDSFTPTKECCDGGCKKQTEDGEHYRGLDRGLVDSFAALLY